MRFDHILDNHRVVCHTAARFDMEILARLCVHGEGLGMPVGVQKPQVGKVLHRKANQMRHRHWHAAAYRCFHGLGSPGPAPALRDHHAESKRVRQRQSGRVYIQRLPHHQFGIEAVCEHCVLAVFDGLCVGWLPPVSEKSAVHFLLGTEQTVAATHELALDHDAVRVVFVFDRAARSFDGHICQRVPFVVSHDHIHTLVVHVLLDIAFEDKLLHHVTGGVQCARGNIRKVL